VSYTAPAVTRGPVSSVASAARRNDINGRGALSARLHGKTGGFARHGKQLVFASSAAAKAPSAASATGDVWSGVQAGRTPASIAAAASAGGQAGGLSSGVLAGLVIFGIGLIGLTGGGLSLAVVTRRLAGGRAGARKR
jgi:hypothetical protein